MDRAQSKTASQQREEDHRRGVGERLALAREAVGKRQVDWAREYQLSSPSKLANWEAGSHYPAPWFLVRLCEDYGFTMDWFYRGVRAGVSVARADDLRRAAMEELAASPAKVAPRA